MTQLAFYFDSTRCTGCKACQIACKEYYHLPTHNLYRRVYEYVGGGWEPTEIPGNYNAVDVFGYKISMACNHCENPACVQLCPTGAMQKDPDTGIVWTDHNVCIGCGTCVNSCPYGAPQLHEDEGYSIKCDFCRDELSLDRKPVCVMGCPARALDCGDVEDLKAMYGEGNIEIAPLPANSTNPTTIINPHKDAQPTGSTVGYCASLPEEI